MILTSRKVSNVAEHVQHRHDDHRDQAVSLDNGDGFLDLVHHVKSVLVSRVGENDVDERVGEIISVLSGALEGIVEVDARVGDTARTPP